MDALKVASREQVNLDTQRIFSHDWFACIMHDIRFAPPVQKPYDSIPQQVLQQTMVGFNPGFRAGANRISQPSTSQQILYVHLTSLRHMKNDESPLNAVTKDMVMSYFALQKLNILNHLYFVVFSSFLCHFIWVRRPCFVLWPPFFFFFLFCPVFSVASIVSALACLRMGFTPPRPGGLAAMAAGGLDREDPGFGKESPAGIFLVHCVFKGGMVVCWLSCGYFSYKHRKKGGMSPKQAERGEDFPSYVRVPSSTDAEGTELGTA